MLIPNLDTAGANIARCFEKWSQYRVVTLEAGKEIPVQETVEDYEKNCPKLKRKIKKIEDEVWFFVAGAAKIAGATLSVLEQIKEHKINVVHIAADPMFLSPKAALREKVVEGVLQQYARCGLLKAIYLVSNKSVLEMLENVPFSEANKAINDTVASMVHYHNIYENTEPMMGHKLEPSNISRIRAFGMVNLEKNEEKLLFPLDNLTETCYIYNINETEMSNDTKIDKIKQLMEEKQKLCKTSFVMYTTKFDQSFCHTINLTHFIQQKEKK